MFSYAPAGLVPLLVPHPGLIALGYYPMPLRGFDPISLRG